MPRLCSQPGSSSPASATQLRSSVPRRRLAALCVRGRPRRTTPPQRSRRREKPPPSLTDIRVHGHLVTRCQVQRHHRAGHPVRVRLQGVRAGFQLDDVGLAMFSLASAAHSDREGPRPGQPRFLHMSLTALLPPPVPLRRCRPAHRGTDGTPAAEWFFRAMKVDPVGLWVGVRRTRKVLAVLSHALAVSASTLQGLVPAGAQGTIGEAK